MADKNLIEDESINLKDVSNINEEDPVAAPIVQLLMEKYNKAETTRRNDEERWLRAYRNYRGLYGPDVQFTEAEKSRVFIKVTKTKTLAAYGQIVDVLFSNNNFPISVDPVTSPPLTMSPYFLIVTTAYCLLTEHTNIYHRPLSRGYLSN